jgi:hypothetical protein
MPHSVGEVFGHDGQEERRGLDVPVAVIVFAYRLCPHLPTLLSAQPGGSMQGHSEWDRPEKVRLEFGCDSGTLMGHHDEPHQIVEEGRDGPTVDKTGPALEARGKPDFGLNPVTDEMRP